MKKVKYIGAVSPWVDSLGGSGLTWTTGMEAVVPEDVGDELTGYPALFEAVAGFDGNGVTPEKVEQAGGAGGGGPTTLPVMQAAFDAGTAAEKATFQASVSGAGSVTIDATRASQSLTDAEQQAQQLVFTGALAADVTFDIGALRRRRAVDVQTTGSGRLILKFGAAGSAFAVPQNEMIEVQ